MSKNKAGVKPLFTVPPPKRNMRCTIEWIDSYQSGGENRKKDVYEGEDVGVNVGINSSIAVPLLIERTRNEKGEITGEVTKFLPHVFIKQITFENVPPKG